MGVYIKGMEMPKSCAFCKIKRRNGEKMTCPLCNEEWDIHDPMSADHRLDNCPLVPVPPHGRLIDGDASEVISFTEEDAVGKDFYDGVLYATDFISQQPTIIPASGGRDMSNVVRLEYAYGVCPKCKRVHYLRYLIHNDGLIHKPYEIKCINCNSYFAKEDILGSGEETAPKPITNADRIRAMTDEKLAELFADNNCGYCRIHDLCFAKGCQIDCEDMWLDWLKQEASNG